jgi:hypothetical protein
LGGGPDCAVDRLLFGADALVVDHDVRHQASERGLVALVEWRTEP